MSVQTDKLESEEPPAGIASAMVGKMSQMLLTILCAGPVAILAMALAHRALRYLFS